MEETKKETEQTRGEDCAKELDAQYEKLKALGCPDQVLDILREQRDEVLKKAGGMTVGEGNIPFLPIIPYTCLSPYSLMSMVRIGDKAGRNYLKSTDIKNVVEVPENPYYIFDIDTGRGTLGKKREEVFSICSEQGRRCLTADEVMNLCIHSNALSSHNVLAGGSSYSLNGIPNVTFMRGDCAALGWVPADFSGGKWAFATCAVTGDEDAGALAGGGEGCSSCGGMF